MPLPRPRSLLLPSICLILVPSLILLLGSLYSHHLGANSPPLWRPLLHSLPSVGGSSDDDGTGGLNGWLGGEAGRVYSSAGGDWKGEGLTDLGRAADEAFRLLPTTPIEAYLDRLEAFIRSPFNSSSSTQSSLHAFPPTLRNQFLSQFHLLFPNDSSTGDIGMLSGKEAGLKAMIESKEIWQTDKDRKVLLEGINGSLGDENVRTWREKSPDWKYNFLDDNQAKAWIRKHFGGSEVEASWNFMHRGVLKADFLRYLVLLVHGGVYSDVDTELLHPIESWGTHSPHRYTLPPLEAYDYAAKPPSVIVGLEVDVHELKWNWDRWWPRPLGVCQWTLSSSPSHPIFLDSIRRILNATSLIQAFESNRTSQIALIDAEIRVLSHRPPAPSASSSTPLPASFPSQDMSKSERKARLMTLNREWSRLKTIKRESVVSVMEWTGPGMFTDSVLAYLEARYGVRWPMLRGLTEPLRIGEVLVLPITGFSPIGEKDFHAMGTEDKQACVAHRFRGSWKKPGEAGSGHS